MDIDSYENLSNREVINLVICLIVTIITCSISSNYFLKKPEKIESGWEKVEASVDAYCTRRLFCKKCYEKYNCSIDIEFTPIGSTEKINTTITHNLRGIYTKRKDFVIYDPNDPEGTVRLERDEIKNSTVGIISIVCTIGITLFCLYTSFYQYNIINIIRNNKN